MRKQIQILTVFIIFTAACFGQAVLVDQVEQAAGYQGLPIPLLSIHASEASYQVTARQCFVYAPVYLALSDSKGLGYVDLADFGLLRVPIVAPQTAFLAFANIHGQAQMVIPKPSAASLPPYLENTPLYGVVICCGAVRDRSSQQGYHTYVISSDATTFLLASATN